MVSLYSFRTAADTVFLFVALALALMCWMLVWATFADHLRNYKYPALQTCCMRILMLAPIYALVSWAMMVFLPLAGYLEALRDFYETYTLYCFWVMLVLWCGGQRRVIEVIDRESALACYLCPLVSPFGCGLPVTRFREANSCFRYLRTAVMQWMVVKPCSALGCAWLAQTRHAHHIRHVRLLVLLSTAVAMHSIFQLYVTMRPYVRGLDASRKFLSLKIVVGMIMAQQVAVNLLLSMDAVPEGSYGYTAEDRAQRFMGTVTILEMAAFSLLLSYLFSHQSMQPGKNPDGPAASAVPSSAGASAARDPAKSRAAARAADDSASRRGPGSAFFKAAKGGKGAGGDAVGVGDSGTALPLSAVGVFSKVLGEVADADAAGDQVSMLSVLTLWDVVCMVKVEERSMQCYGASLPLPVELDSDGFIQQFPGLREGSERPAAGPSLMSLTTAVPRPTDAAAAAKGVHAVLHAASAAAADAANA